MNRRDRRRQAAVGGPLRQGPGGPQAPAGLLEAVRMHQAGRIDEAERLYRQVLSLHPDQPDALQFLGVICHQRGDAEGALALIDRAIAKNRKAPAYHDNRGAVLMALGRVDEAVESYRRALKLKPDSAVTRNNLGAAYQRLGRIDEAIAAYRRALQDAPDYAEALNNLGTALQAQGRAAEAVDCLKKALGLNPAYAEAANNLGNALQAQGDLAAAGQEYARAVQLRPGYAEALANWGSALEADGRLDEAALRYRQAIDARPDYGRALRGLASVLQGQGQTDQAEATLKQAIASNSADSQALSRLAALYEKAGRLEDGLARAGAALALDPGDVLAAAVAAKCERRLDNPAAGRARLEAMLGHALEAEAASYLRFELAALCDRMGDFEAAFGHYTDANRLAGQTPRAKAVDRDLFPRWMAGLEAVFDQDWVAGWQDCGPADGPIPGFIVGFPRSGTTLLDQILNAHPGLETVEEKPPVDVTKAAVEKLDGGYPGALATLSAEQASALRQVYWADMARYRGADAVAPDRITVVDKMPLNATEVGLIHRIFPTAPIILALRHPCDVVLSGFMQAFNPNPTMVHFDSLESTARLYDRVMGLWLRYDRLLPLRRHVVRYEDMVADFEGETRKILDFLGLPWDDAVLGYREKAKTRAISTPSYHQVVQPIYSRSVKRWHNYRAHFEPILPILEPYIKAFGYDLD